MNFLSERELLICITIINQLMLVKKKKIAYFKKHTKHTNRPWE